MPSHIEQIYEAVEIGDLGYIQGLVNRGVNIDLERRIESGISNKLLTTASYFQQTAIVEFLLHKGLDPNIQDSHGNTALHYAAFNGDIQTINTLLKHRFINLDSYNEKQRTPLYTLLWNFIYCERTPAILLQMGIQCLAALLRGGASYNQEKLEKFFKFSIPVVEDLVELAIQNIQLPYEIIHDAAEIGDISAVQAFLNQGINIESKRIFQLNLKDAPRGGNWDTPLIAASNYKQFEMVEFLLQSGANPNTQDSRGNTALHYAALNGDVQTINSLLKHPYVAVNLQNCQEETPLNILYKSFCVGYRSIIPQKQFEVCLNRLRAKNAVPHMQSLKTIWHDNFIRIWDTLTAEEKAQASGKALLYRAPYDISNERAWWNARRLLLGTKFLNISAYLSSPESMRNVERPSKARTEALEYHAQHNRHLAKITEEMNKAVSETEAHEDVTYATPHNRFW
jgi:cytohesin